MNPLEMTNLAHATHATPAREIERVRLRQRLTDVMHEHGTTPDEIRWPSAGDYRPATTVAAASEEEDAVTA